MQAAGLIGKSVLVAGSGLTLVDGEALGGARLAGPADKVTLSILDAAGKVVQSQNLGRPRGRQLQLRLGRQDRCR
jgi:flagellar basal-body rod modification protein FlgD